ncbi:hypothetical protein [Luteimicrobium subarcticum]|uniref:Uncharacterized protein n=1 Tax=Luteimicrobium subarcticum TaxID=620910 RepID=A0A2M8WWC1_9MICO|nr:hypothetical protein [Luteimicrobium subarcticum]PJI95213.1 hypothetical protein CLV34_0087 [Luteimicrobium subarcticum]
MRWDALFDDMEAQLAAHSRAEREARADDLTRAEQAGVSLADRIRAARGEIVLVLVDGSRQRGHVVGGADEWVDLADGPRRALVPVAAVAWVERTPHAATAGSAVERRLGLGHALRALARDRVRVSVRTAAGAPVGRVARVGRDHLDLDAGAERPGDLGTTIPFARILCVSEVL